MIAVDLGGTTVRARAYTEGGEPVGERVQRPSFGREGSEKTLEATVAAIREAATGKQPVAVGVAIPGHVEGGRVRWAPNLGMESAYGRFDSWRDIEAERVLVGALGLPVRLANDANLAALGEYRYGSGRDSARTLVMLTLGTGVGGGVVLGRHSVSPPTQSPTLLLGGNGGGVELGHLCIQMNGLECDAGSYGSLEAYCQKDSVVRRALHRLGRGRASSLADISPESLSPEAIARAAESGDALARQVLAETGMFLGTAIGSLINVFAPEVVAVGGQIAKAGEWILAPAREAARETAVPTLFPDTRIVQAEQIDDAGMLGAAAFAFEAIAVE